MTSDRPDIHTSLCERQAWVITAEYLDPVFFIKERFVALLDPRIDGATLLHITNHLYMSTLFALDGQPSLRRDETRDPHPASFLILNDGSLWEDHIICGHEPGL